MALNPTNSGPFIEEGVFFPLCRQLPEEILVLASDVRVTVEVILFFIFCFTLFWLMRFLFFISGD